ncbi:hypothetical protein NS44R_15085, partial [Mammaliicoccus sciuri]
ECGGRLVGDQQLRLAGQGDGDRDALAHAAGKLVRVLFQPLLGRGDADFRQQFDAALPRPGEVELEMFLNGLDQLGADGQHRVERGHRILKHHRQRAAAQLAQFLRRQLGQILSAEHHPAGQFRLLGQQLQDGARQHGLAAAGFADNAERPAGADGEIDMIHRPQIAARRRQVDHRILDRQQRAAHSAPCRGSVNARMVSPIRLNESTVRNIAIAGMKASIGATSRLSRPSPIMLPQP